MNIKRILITLGLSAFLVACSTTGDIVEYGTTKKNDTEIKKITTIIEEKNKYNIIEDDNETNNYNIVKKTNNEILENENYKKVVFDRNKRIVNKNMKGIWLTTLFNLDFPKTTGAENQKNEIKEIVRNIKNWGFNAIFLQIKPEAGVFYNSQRLPWSKYLTGKEDANPGYDPLQYFIEIAHQNGIELHAWINPYRVSLRSDLDGASSRNIGVIHPDWLFRYSGKLYLDPSKKGVVEYLYNTIEEVVTNYDVDGIHLDDYFYPYPSQNDVKLANFDQETYDSVKHKYANINDFRRDQVNDLIRNLSVSIHKIKPSISFGVAPFGIWRNKKSDYRGSNTAGLQSYDDLYADTIKWMEEKWIDYVAPQLYWKIDNPKAGYKTLVEWWNQKSIETNTPLYIGEGYYKLFDEPEKWNWPSNEPENHSIIRARNSAVNGYIIFRYNFLKENPWLIDAVK